MAADSTLVKGAYDANKGYGIDRSGISKAINKGIPALDKAVEKSSKRKRKLEEEAREQREAEEIKTRKQREVEGRKAKQETASKSHQDRLSTAIDMYGNRKSTWFFDGTEVDRKIELQKIEIDNKYNKASDNLGVDSHFENFRSIVEQQKKDIEPSKLKETGVKVLNKLSVGLQSFKDLKDRLVTAHRERKKGTGFQKNMDLETDELLANIAAGNIPFSTRNVGDDSELGFKLANGDFLNVGDVERLLEDNQVDIESQNNINDIVSAQISKAVLADPRAEFNVPNVSKSIRGIVKRGNMNSLVNDEVFGGTSFIEDLFASNQLTGIKYRDLGVMDFYDQDGDGEISADDNLSLEDQRAIVEELIDNPNQAGMLEDMVVDYYTQYVKTQWDNNHEGPERPEETLSRNALSAMTQNLQEQSKSRLDESTQEQIDKWINQIDL